MFPGEGWKLQPDGTMEILGRSAAIFCYIPEDFNKSVTFIFIFESADFPVGEQVSFEWDGQSLFQSPVQLTGQPVEVLIDSLLLSPGLHALTVKRTARQGQEQSRKERGGFSQIGYRIGNQEHLRNIDKTSVKGFLYQFLRFGVAGAGKQKKGGFIFGSTRIRVG